MRRLPTLLAALLALLLLGGCVQAEEVVALELDGSGTYDLDLTWDAGLVRRLVELVGEDTASRLGGRAFPLTEAAWRETLEGLAGIEVQTVDVEAREGGLRHLTIRLAFDRLESLLAWELFARRTTRVVPAREAADPQGAVAWTQDPLARVPVLDPLARALATRDRPPAPPDGGQRFPLLDPEPLERLGLSSAKAALAARILQPALGDIVFTVRMKAPRTVRTLRMAPAGAGAEGREARFPLTFRDLGRHTDRRLRLTWVPRPADVVPSIDHPGDGPGVSR